MTLEKGSLILLDYTAKIKDTNEIFETTRENDIKDSQDFDPSRKYEPRLLGVGEGWVLKGALRFTVVVKAELVHRCIADSPGMADVPLLKTLISDGAKTGHIRPGRLKLREGRNQMIIVEIVIKA